MGLFDSVAGAILGKLGGEHGSMAQMAMEMLNQNGGVSGVLERFKAAGYTEHVTSWVGMGENFPISAEQISDVLGSEQLAEIAAKFGISTEVLSAKLAEYLPMAVDKMTPDGQVPVDTSTALIRLMGLLKA